MPASPNRARAFLQSTVLSIKKNPINTSALAAALLAAMLFTCGIAFIPAFSGALAITAGIGACAVLGAGLGVTLGVFMMTRMQSDVAFNHPDQSAAASVFMFGVPLLPGALFFTGWVGGLALANAFPLSGVAALGVLTAAGGAAIGACLGWAIKRFKQPRQFIKIERYSSDDEESDDEDDIASAELRYSHSLSYVASHGLLGTTPVASTSAGHPRASAPAPAATQNPAKELAAEAESSHSLSSANR